MASDERLLALKKAYADIILNTAKESAARIMLSERKAQRFQRELQVAKDEALRMLLRLKQMMDFKIAEAETRSLSQQGKIEELEAQLQEAEDIVKDLRDELRDVQSELERTRNNKLQHLDENCSSMPGTLPEADKAFSSKFFVAPPPASQFYYVPPAEPRTLHEFEIHNFQKFYKVEPDKAHSNDGCPNMPSTILVNKEPELYRNGCTQRIRASEGDPSARNPSFSGQMTDNKDEKFAIGTDNGVNSVTELPCDSEKQKSFEKNEKEDRLCSDRQLIKPFPVRRKRARYRRKWGYALRKLSETSSKVSHVSCIEAHPNPVRSVVDVNTSEECQQLSLDRAEPISLASGEEVSVNQQPVTDCCSPENPVKKIKVTEDEIARHGNGSEENSVTAAETGAGSIQLPESNSSRPYEDQGALGRPISERIIKITFQRKRKKETLGGSNETTSMENVASKEPKMDQDQEVGLVEEENSDLAPRSCRDSRRLMQVARQLISMSEKKW